MLLAEVVLVARKPGVFVRLVTPEEGWRLQKIAKTSKQPIRMRRAIVVMASAQRQPVGLICRLMQVSENYARQVIHDFNEQGFAALDPNGAGAGRVRLIGRRVNGSTRSLGAAPVTWDGRSRRGVCRSYVRCYVSTQSPTSAGRLCGRSLKTKASRGRATRTWKAGKDPEFTAKMDRVLDLYDHPPADGRVICVDEFGPLNLQPRAGRGWQPRR